MKYLGLYISLGILFTGCVQEMETRQVAFQVTAEPGMTIAVRGDSPALDWDSDLILDDSDNDGLYTGRFELQTPYLGTTYKITRNGVFELEGQDNRELKFNLDGLTQVELEYDNGDSPLESSSLASARATGIGGIFFKSKDPKSLYDWYAKHLGLQINEFGAPFEFRNTHRPDEINYLNWGVFTDDTDYMDPSPAEFMINYRVEGIHQLVNTMEAEGVTVLDSITDYGYGLFVHVLDGDGNKLELWQPVDSVLTAYGGKVNR